MLFGAKSERQTGGGGRWYNCHTTSRCTARSRGPRIACSRWSSRSGKTTSVNTATWWDYEASSWKQEGPFGRIHRPDGRPRRGRVAFLHEPRQDDTPCSAGERGYTGFML